MCGTDWIVFGGVSVCCVWECLEWVKRSECVLHVGLFGVSLGESVCRTFWSDFGGRGLCCLWDCLKWIWGD